MDRKYNLRLDLQFRCNNSVMKFRQSDNKTSDFFMRITSGGELLNIDNAIVILAVIKPNQTAQSQFLEVKEGKVYADLNSNMKDQVGIYKAQALLIYEDERVSTDIIEYEVAEDNILNQLQANVSTTEEFTMLQQMLSRLSTIEQQENQRELNESDRIKSEEDRVAAEKERVKSEDIRNHEEADRGKYEATRQSNENKRIDNENIRISTENKRIYDESIRAANEESRIAAETERVNNYNFMTDDEERRRTEANSQAAAERLRVEAETERVNEEARRRTVEKSRVAAEETREQNENTRVAAEKLRVEAEQTRAQEHITKMQSIDTTLKDLETTKTNLVKTVDDKILQADTKIQEVNKTSTDMQNTVNTKMQEVDAAEQQRATDHQAREQFLNSFESQLAQIENKNIEQDTRIKEVDRVNKTQQVYINGLFNENKDGRLSVEGEGNSLKLEGSKSGLVEVDKVVGNTLVNLAPEGVALCNDTSDFKHNYYDIEMIQHNECIEFKARSQGYLIAGYDNRDNNMMKLNTKYLIIADVEIVNIDGDYIHLDVPGLKKEDKVLYSGRGVAGCTFTSRSDDILTGNYGWISLRSVNSNESVGNSFKVYNFNVIELTDEEYSKSIDELIKKYGFEFSGLQSSFESNLVTEEMITQGLESEENLGKYKVPIRIVGKNLFTEPIISNLSTLNKGEYVTKSSWQRISTIHLEKGTYYFKFKIKSTENYTSVSNNSVFRLDYSPSGGGGVVQGSTHTMNITADYVEYVKIVTVAVSDNINVVIRNSEEKTVYVKDIIISECDTSYEEYFERTTNAYLNSPLLEGDEIVMKDGELCHYHKCGYGIVDGSDDEKWTQSNGDSVGIYKYVTCNTYADFMPKAHSSNATLINNYGLTMINPYSNPNSGMMFVLGSSLRVRLAPNKDTLLEDFLTTVRNNPIIIVYTLSEPYYEPIQSDKLILECINDSTIHIETVVPVESVSVSYTGNVPSVYSMDEDIAINTEDISVTQTAVDFLLMSSMGEVMMMSFNENTKGGNQMGAYFASRIMKGALKYEDVIRKYPEFKDDIDFILRSEGYEHLIVEIQ